MQPPPHITRSIIDPPDTADADQGIDHSDTADRADMIDTADTESLDHSDIADMTDKAAETDTDTAAISATSNSADTTGCAESSVTMVSLLAPTLRALHVMPIVPPSQHYCCWADSCQTTARRNSTSVSNETT